jgi:hypothetical protein
MTPGKARTDIFEIRSSQKFQTQSYYKYQILNIGTNDLLIGVNGRNLQNLSTGDEFIIEVDYRLIINDNIDLQFTGAGTNIAQIVAVKVEEYPVY